MPQIRDRSERDGDTIEAAVDARIRRGAKRLGYFGASAANGVMLWVAHQLLDWEWPGFLTAEYEDVLPIITVSFVAGIVANAVYAWKDAWPVKPAVELATTVIGFAVTLRLWQVFPFEFTGDDWSWLVRLALVLAFIGTTLGAVAQFVNLVKGGLPQSDRTQHS